VGSLGAIVCSINALILLFDRFNYVKIVIILKAGSRKSI
jgi:hypothetical protein